jgi:hypothetical protein
MRTGNGLSEAPNVIFRTEFKISGVKFNFTIAVLALAF